MSLVLKATRILGGAAALCLLILLSAILFENLRNYGFTARFFWGQLLPVYIPYLALLVLLMMPYSRIEKTSAWTSLFIATVFLSLVWLVPVAYRAISVPTFHVEKPPGEGVAPKILITRSYGDVGGVSLIAGFLSTQILAIWWTRRRGSTDAPRLRP